MRRHSEKRKRKRLAAVGVLLLLILTFSVSAFASSGADADGSQKNRTAAEYDESWLLDEAKEKTDQEVDGRAEEDYHDSNPRDYITERFDVELKADESHATHVKETIQVDFIQAHHGVYRNIPDGDRIYSVENVHVSGYPYKVSKEDGEVQVRIGDANKYLTGEQTFVLDYDLVYYLDDSAEADYLMQNLLPTDWDTSIRESMITFTMPDPVDWDEMDYYAGYQGSTGSLEISSFQRMTKGVSDTLMIRGSDLRRGCGVTVIGSLKDGYWSQAQTYVQAHKGLIIRYGLLFAIPTVIMVILFLLFGKDPKLVKTVEFRPPEGMTPLEAGYLIDGEADDADCMAMILYFAAKGWLTIRETSKDHYKLTKVCEIDLDEEEFSKTLFYGLFKNSNEVMINRIREGFADDISKAKSQVGKKYDGAENSIFKKGCRIARFVGGAFLLLFALISIFAFESAFSWFPVIMLAVMTIGVYSLLSSFDHRYSTPGVKKTIAGSVITGGSIALVAWSAGRTIVPLFGLYVAVMMGIILILTLFMQARTKENMQLMGRLMGFRDFIKKAEYDRLKRLSDEDPEYFYEILPYAEVMGLRSAWASKFTQISPQQPGWYSSYERGPYVYHVLWCDHLMDRCVVHGAPTRSGGGSSGGGGYSGGFSGGGFSGGGGGGGGGGAW